MDPDPILFSGDFLGSCRVLTSASPPVDSDKQLPSLLHVPPPPMMDMRAYKKILPKNKKTYFEAFGIEDEFDENAEKRPQNKRARDNSRSNKRHYARRDNKRGNHASK